MTQMPGTFITFEGGEGCGKSTQIHALECFLLELGRAVLVVREPGGTEVGEIIRTILLNPANTALTQRAELFLYEAARAQIVTETIEPALEAGTVVLCDRFYDSTLAYQGFGRGIPLETIEALNEVAVGTCHPQRTILLDIDSNKGLKRATVHESDRLEQAGEAFHERVRTGFLTLAAHDPHRIRLVNSCESKVDTACAVMAELSDLFDDLDDAYVRAVYESDPLRYFGGTQ
jgi:dTMP kinase